jgi:hypothetical protein
VCSLVVSVLLALGAFAEPGAAAASGPILVASNSYTRGRDTSEQGADAALYVDSSGAAHLAWIAGTAGQDGTSSQTGYIDECTLKPVATHCGAVTSLATSVVSTGEGSIDALKYLAGAGGSEYLAVGLSGEPEAGGSAGETGPETEVFGPTLGSGLDLGDLSFSDGDLILTPGASGVDVVGTDSDYAAALNAYCEPPAYEADSFTLGATTPPVFPAGAPCTSAGTPGVAGVTELPNGQGAVFAYNYAAASSDGAAPVVMYVQPVAGGAFGSARPLGVSSAFETVFSPSEGTYLLNVEIDQAFADSSTIPMELYQFRGTALKPVATVGDVDDNAIDPNDGEGTWKDLPPIFEDAKGNLYVSWEVTGGNDGCLNVDPSATECTVERRIIDGAVPGPIVVMSNNFAPDGKATTPGGVIPGLGPVASDAEGQAWGVSDLQVDQGVSYTDEGYVNDLYLTPFPTSAEVTTSPSVGSDEVSVGLSCSGAPSSSCKVDGVLAASGRTGSGARVVAKTKRTIYGEVIKTLRGGASGKLVLKLNKAGRALLSRTGRLKGTLAITETVGVDATPTTLLSRSVSFHKRTLKKKR